MTLTVTAYLNGVSLGSNTAEVGICYPNDCSEGLLSMDFNLSGDIPGYNYGGSNIFTVNIEYTGSGEVPVVSGLLALDYYKTDQKLDIVYPVVGSDFDLTKARFISTEPVDFLGRAEPAGGTDSISWNIALDYKTSGGKGAFTSTRSFQSIPEVTYPDTFVSQGGSARVSASATIGAQIIEAQPVVFTVTGVQIPDSEITHRLVNLYNGPTQRLMTGIAMRESSYMQFKKRVLYGVDDLWPYESRDGGSHIGLMQVKVNKKHAWDWLKNTEYGVNLFVGEKIPAARRNANRIRDEAQTLYGCHLRSLSDVEIENMAILLYGEFAPEEDRIRRQYYYYQVMPGRHQGEWNCSWVENTYGNPRGVGYVKEVRNLMR